ncbi:hypothetical protein MTR67_012585 [Solanum verrucosum]|uniref:Uncharacterized protein n=1 Tax=Solanum verrucosum TaxID=315347 RepID=A0AAF0QDB1_SOLVR|nr:hypothetical protein MTR67_012585 [Solanum verrucosum]
MDREGFRGSSLGARGLLAQDDGPSHGPSSRSRLVMGSMITYHDKATQTETEEEDTIEKILKVITTLSTKVDSMDNEIQKLKTNEDNLKSKAGQQHDYKNAELRRSEDGKNPELKGDDGKLLKTHNVCLNTAAEERPTTRALKAGFISTELLTRYCKLIGHKYPDHICSKCNGEDNIIPDVQLE